MGLSNLADKERQAKLKAIEIAITDMSWEHVKGYTKRKHDRTFWAQRIMKDIEQVELDFSAQWYEANMANREGMPF